MEIITINETAGIKVLDHGFVTLRNISGPTRRKEYWHTVNGMEVRDDSYYDADDIDPAQAARMSFNQMDSNRTREQDLKLCEYLLKNRHTSPFEMIEVWLEMKLPIFVARQFVRHRTVSINEVSGRYVTLPPEWYIPEVVGGKAANKKQGQEDNLPRIEQDIFQLALNEHCETGYKHYLEAIGYGVAPEHARLFLSLNHYTHWLWKQDLHNIMHFLSLRDHPHAQTEAQMYAKAITELLRSVLPETMKLYEQYRRIT